MEKSPSNILEKKRLSMTMSLICLAIFALSYLTNAMDRQIFPMLLSWISKTYGFDLKESGLLSTVFTLGIGLAAWPTGLLLDRRPRKEVLIIGMIIYSVFTYATTLSRGFMDMLIYNLLTGVGEGMQIAALFAAGGSYFYNNKALVIGTINFGYGVGCFLGPYYGTRLMLATNDWHMPFIIFAAMGIAMALVIWFAIPSVFSESKGPVTNNAVNGADKVLFDNMPEEFWNRNLGLVGVAAVTWGFALYSYMSLYSTFLIKQLNFAPMLAGTSFGFFGIGAMFGIPAGWLGDRYSNRRVAIGAWCGLAINWYLMYNVMTEPWQHNILSLLTGLFATSCLHANVLSLAQRSVRPEFVGRATGFFSSCGFTAASFAGIVFAWAVQIFGWTGAALIISVGCPLIAVVALLLIKDAKLSITPKKIAVLVNGARDAAAIGR
jgi:MFS family permease